MDLSQPVTTNTDVLKFHVESRIKHRYARTVITSVVSNKAASAQEVSFNITLPESAFISAFQMEIDDKVYKAYVKEKEAAKQEYMDALAFGLSAAHVEQSVRDSNKFTVSVNVEKTKTVTFKLTYEEMLRRELSAYKHVVNINPGQIVPELLVEVYIEESVNLSLLEVPPLQESCELQLNPTTEVNKLAKIERPKPNEAVIRWSPDAEEQKKLGANGVTGQLLVRYDVERKSNSEQILINNGYFVHFFAPTDLPVLRKHVVFVLDVSGSMQGRKMEQMKDAMKTILNDIGSDDYFSLIIFSTDVRVWDPDVIEPLLRAEREGECGPRLPNELPEAVVVRATASNIEKAKLFVLSLHDDSATNIHGALLRSIEVAHLGKKLHKSEKITGPRPEPMIIFLTDGQPNVGESNPDEITSLTTKANTDAGAALFSLAFGDDADMEFLKKLSLRNSGFARKIYEAADAALQLSQFYRLVASPLLANVQFKYEDKEVVPGSVTNTTFRTLFNGCELVVAGKLHSDQISGQVASDSCGVQKSSCICKPTVMPRQEHDFMERLWAFLTVKQLLDNVTADTDVAANKKQALELALKYSFVTPLTSLVVVKPDEPAKETDPEIADTEESGLFGVMKKIKKKKYPAPAFGTQSVGSFRAPQCQALSGSGFTFGASGGSIMLQSASPRGFSASGGSIMPCSLGGFGNSGGVMPKRNNTKQRVFGGYMPQSASSGLFGSPGGAFSNSGHTTSAQSGVFGTQRLGFSSSPAFPVTRMNLCKSVSDTDDAYCDLMEYEDEENVSEETRAGPEILKHKVSSLHVKANVWCRYASTVVEQVFVNNGDTTEVASFNMYLTLSAVISQCSLSVDGKAKNLRLLATNQGEQSFTASKKSDRAAVLVLPSTSDGQRGVTVCVLLPPQTTVTFKLQYEEFLEDFGDGYLYTFTLNPGQVVPDLQITVNIEGFYKLADVRALHIIPFSPKEEVLDQMEVKFNTADGHNKALLSWSPSVSEQSKLFGTDRTMQLGVEYKAQPPSFGSPGPDGEVVLDESGQTIHVHLPSSLTPEAEAARRHLILLLHIGSTTTTEMREQITTAARNLLLKLQDGDSFSIIVCSSDLQVWEDSGSVMSGTTSLGTDRFAASQGSITKATDFIKQALATVPPKDPSIEAALTKAFQVSSPTEQARSKIFVLSTSETSFSEVETRAIATKLKKANAHKAAIFSLVCGSTSLLALLRDVAADSLGFACELHKQTVERLLDLFFRISEFDKISCKVIRQLPVFEGFMDKFWLKEAIEQSTGDGKIQQSLTHNIATSETSFYGDNE